MRSGFPVKALGFVIVVAMAAIPAVTACEQDDYSWACSCSAACDTPYSTLPSFYDDVGCTGDVYTTAGRAADVANSTCAYFNADECGGSMSNVTCNCSCTKQDGGC